MRPYTIRLAVALASAVFLVLAIAPPLPSVFGEGGARRDVVRHEKQNLSDAIKHAKDAVDHGKQGHAKVLVRHAEAALQYAMKGGTNPHLDEAIAHLKEAIEHGKAGHADVAAQHAESALRHLEEEK